MVCTRFVHFLPKKFLIILLNKVLFILDRFLQGSSSLVFNVITEARLHDGCGWAVQ
jgi:hypothetical protein